MQVPTKRRENWDVLEKTRAFMRRELRQLAVERVSVHSDSHVAIPPELQQSDEFAPSTTAADNSIRKEVGRGHITNQSFEIK